MAVQGKKGEQAREAGEKPAARRLDIIANVYCRRPRMFDVLNYLLLTRASIRPLLRGLVDLADGTAVKARTAFWVSNGCCTFRINELL